MPRARGALATASALALFCGGPGAAQTLPTGGAITQGTGAISQTETSLTVEQQSHRLSVDWKSFSIGKNDWVRFLQPGADAVALNRVLGSEASRILGRLSANGQVFLLNPHGVIFGEGARVDVGGLVASTLELSDERFMAGRYAFEAGATAGSVVNLGEIAAADGGYVALIGPRVSNKGVISARFGTVALGAGNRATLDMEGGSLLSFGVEEAALEALAENRGAITADGGMVLLDARAKESLVETVINTDGIIRARSLEERDGVIVLSGGDEGVVRVGGTLDASGAGADESGGTVHVLGDRVALGGGAAIDVSGEAGGGEVLVGGDYQGGGAVQTASRTLVEAGATIAADATGRGDGGRVILWADGATAFHGEISARGGAEGGHGGFVEVSGKQHLDYRGATDLRAPQGEAGTLLLDPTDIIIRDQASDQIEWNAASFLFASVDDPDVSVLSTGLLESQLGLGHVTVSTASDGAAPGDITVEDGFGWASDFDLTLLADRHIQVDAPITNIAGSGSLTLRADRQGTGTGTVAFGDAGAIAFGAGDVSVFYNPASFPTPDFDTSKVTMGSGDLTAFMLVNTLDDLDGIRGNLSGTYALGDDIDASATSTWNGARGFEQIGSGGGANRFSGVLDGRGHEISGLFIERPGDESAGLFGRTSGAEIRNLGLVDVDITGGVRTGGLAGWMDGGSISQVYVAGSVRGLDGVDPDDPRANFVGGLVGRQDGGVISRSRMTGAVTGQNFVGGLVGSQRDDGEIGQSFAAATVTGKQNVGGLVGRSDGTISRSFAGAIDDSGLRVLVDDQERLFGDENPSLTFTLEAFPGGPRPMAADSEVRVTGEARVGGLVGWQHGGEISQSFATVPVTGEQDVGGLVGRQQTGAITRSYAAGPVSGGENVGVGGLVGWRGTGETIVASFWDTETSGQERGVGSGGDSGVTGRTTDELMQQATLAGAGWDFDSTWSLAEGDSYPFHLWSGVAVGEDLALSEAPVLATTADQTSPVGSYEIFVANHEALQAGADAGNIDLTVINGTLTVINDTLTVDPPPAVPDNALSSVAEELNTGQTASTEIGTSGGADVVTPEDGITGGADLVTPDEGVSGDADLVTPDEGVSGDADVVTPDDEASGDAEVITPGEDGEATGDADVVVSDDGDAASGEAEVVSETADEENPEETTPGSAVEEPAAEEEDDENSEEVEN